MNLSKSEYVSTHEHVLMVPKVFEPPKFDCIDVVLVLCTPSDDAFHLILGGVTVLGFFLYTP